MKRSEEDAGGGPPALGVDHRITTGRDASPLCLPAVATDEDTRVRQQLPNAMPQSAAGALP